MNDPDTGVSDQLARLRERFLERLQDDCQALSALLEQLDNAEPDSPRQATLLMDARDRLHRLAGSSGTFGFPELGNQARLLEHQLEVCLADDTPPQDVLAALLPALREFARQPPAGSPASATSDLTVTGKGGTAGEVLVYEPDAELADRLAGQLRPFGFEVRVLEQREALETCLQDGEVPELAFVDLDALDDLDDESGLWRSLAALSEIVTLVVYSERDDFSQRLRAVRIGAEAYLLKPLDLPETISLLVRLLEQRQSAPIRVLVIEDDDLLAAHFEEVLQQAGMEARCLDEPQSLLSEVVEWQPDIVLLDLHLPDIMGDELAAMLRQQTSWVTMPIMFISAEKDRHRQAAALRRGADDFLTKPVSDETLIMSLQARVERAREMRILISRDGMTGLLRHSSFLESAAIELDRSRRQDYPVVVVMLDLDHFKHVNDTWGHTTGDMVIRALATMLRQRLRQTDIIGRYGGEEFAALLSDCVLEDAVSLVESVRQRFGELVFNPPSGEPFSCTLSAGLVSSEQDAGGDIGTLIKQADQALYKAKEAGRNRIEAGSMAIDDAD